MDIGRRGMMLNPVTYCPENQAGFTLIEIMVSVFVLSVGLLGLANLQAISLQSNQSAFMRSQISTLAYDLADRMRANVAGATSDFYDPSMAGTTASCYTTAGCTQQQLAQTDLADWNSTITSYLPMGQGFVCIDSTPDDGSNFADPQCDGAGDQFAIKIWWDDDRDGLISVVAPAMERFVISFQL